MNRSPPNPKASGARGTERKRRIFRSLHDCIISKGYVKTTLADVANAAGMTPSHLLYYFNGKEDILEQYFQSVSEQFVARLDEFASSPEEQQINLLADFWFRGETSTMQEIGFMLECFGAAVHDHVLRVTKADFDARCKLFLAQIFEQAPAAMLTNAKDAAEIAYSMMIGLRSAVYFDDDVGLEDAHRLFSSAVRRMCGYDN